MNEWNVIKPHSSHNFTLRDGYCAGCGSWRGSVHVSIQRECVPRQPAPTAVVDWLALVRSAGR
jgi:hypothetical protein